MSSRRIFEVIRQNGCGVVLSWHEDVELLKQHLMWFHILLPWGVIANGFTLGACLSLSSRWDVVKCLKLKIQLLGPSVSPGAFETRSRVESRGLSSGETRSFRMLNLRNYCICHWIYEYTHRCVLSLRPPLQIDFNRTAGQSGMLGFIWRREWRSLTTYQQTVYLLYLQLLRVPIVIISAFSRNSFVWMWWWHFSRRALASLGTCRLQGTQFTRQIPATLTWS